MSTDHFPGDREPDNRTAFLYMSESDYEELGEGEVTLESSGEYDEIVLRVESDE